ncbi:MAG: hypothetical protein MPJ24_01335 [Pirellulaceae bacterium]|nr:hypothetical protein [Pirellulaceae bacterium]
MSNGPFEIFRKNQKILLGFFGVVLMLAFVVVPPLLDYVQKNANSGRQNPSSLVASWEGGDLTYGQLSQIQQRRANTQDIVEALGQAALAKGGVPDIYPFAWSRNIGTTPLETTYYALLLDEADKMGISTSDEMANDFILHLTDNKLDNKEISTAINKGSEGTMRVREFQKQLQDDLKVSLLLSLALSGFQDGHLATHPDRPWHYHKLLNRRVTAEIVPVKVDDFIAKVTKEPSEDEIRAEFENRKTVKTPPKYGFEILKADYDTYFEAAKKEISEDEIKKYYEENKELYRIITVETTTDPGKDLGQIVEENKSDTEASATTVEEKKGEGTTIDKKDDTKAADKKEKQTEEKKNSDKTESKDKTDKSTDGSKDKSTDKSDGNQRDKAPSLEGLENRAVKLLTPNNADQEKQEKKEEQKKVGEKQEQSDQKSDDQKVETSTQATQEKKEKTKTEEAQPDDKYKPLSEVRETIIDLLAYPLAMTNTSEALAKAQEELTQYETAYNEAIAEKITPPARPDFEELAQKYNLVAQTIPLMSGNEFVEEKVKNDEGFEVSKYDIQRINNGGFAYTAFVETAVSDKFKPYIYPAETSLTNFSQDRFLYWKVDELAPHFPELEEIRGDIVNDLKKPAALELAKEAAFQLAEEIRTQSLTEKENFDLAKFLTDREGLTVIDTGEFAQKQFMQAIPGTQFTQPSLMNPFVAGAQIPDDQFMETAFSLKQYEVGPTDPTKVPSNFVGDSAFVIRLLSDPTSEEELMSQFKQSKVSGEIAVMLENENNLSALFAGYLDSLIKTKKFLTFFEDELQNLDPTAG